MSIAFVAVLLAAAGAFAQRLRVPHALGYILAGIAIAPSITKVHLLEDEMLATMGELGILLLLFMIGMELDLGRLQKNLRAVAPTLPFDLLVPFALVTLLGRGLGWSPIESIVLGLAASLSSTLFGESLATKLEGPARQRVLSILVGQDVAAGALIATVAVLGAGGSGFGEIIWDIFRLSFILVILTGIGILVVPKILDAVSRYHVHELVVLWGLGLLALFATVGQWAGSAELGAFIAGVATAESGSRYVTKNAMQSLRDIGVAIFLFWVGYTSDIWQILTNPLPSILLALAFLVAKMSVHLVSSGISRQGFKNAWGAAASLSTMGEFSLVLVALASQSGIANASAGNITLGAVLILLPLASLAQQGTHRVESGYRKLPEAVRDTLEWLGRLLHFERTPKDAKVWRKQAGLLAANVLLLLALGLVVSLTYARLDGLLPFAPRVRLLLISGAFVAIAIPVGWKILQSYRDLVWTLVGLKHGETEGAGKLRARIVDIMVVASILLVLTPIAASIPGTLPVLAAVLLTGALLATLGWRQLTRFHDAMEQSLHRVLGKEDDSEIIDDILQMYPWGVRAIGVPIGPESPVARKHIQDARITELSGATLFAVQRGTKEFINPDKQLLMLPGDKLILLGDAHQLARAESIIVAHGQAIRLVVPSKQAKLLEFALPEDSPHVGKKLNQIRIKHNTGAMLTGIWPMDVERPLPFSAELVLQAGDRLILLGTNLQLERVAKFLKAEKPAEPVEEN